MANTPPTAGAVRVLKDPWAVRAARSLWECAPSLVCGAIAAVATAVAISQSYHLGLSLGHTAQGKQSMSLWLALIDICTAALPIFAVVVWRFGLKRWSMALWAITAIYVTFSMASQVGFAASERFAAVAIRQEIPKEAKLVKDRQFALIQDQIKWHNGTKTKRVTPKVQGKYTLEAYKAAQAAEVEARKLDSESILKLIEKAGEFDPKSVQAAVADPQAMALSKLSGGWVTEEQVAIWLSVLAAALVILAKPLFYGLAAYLWPGSGRAAAATAAAREETPDTAAPIVPEAPAIAALVPAEAPDEPAVAAATEALSKAPETEARVLPLAEPARSPEALDVDAEPVPTEPPAQALTSSTSALAALAPKARRPHAQQVDADEELEQVREFLAQMTEGSAYGCPATEVYQQFCVWHRASGYGPRPMSQMAFGRHAEALGVTKSKRSDGRCIEYHLRLRSVPAAAQPRAA